MLEDITIVLGVVFDSSSSSSKSLPNGFKLCLIEGVLGGLGGPFGGRAGALRVFNSCTISSSSLSSKSLPNGLVDIFSWTLVDVSSALEFGISLEAIAGFTSSSCTSSSPK